MKPRAFAARLSRLEAKVATRWAWNVPLLAWPAQEQRLLFAVIAERPRWLETWPAERHAWLLRALERNPHIFPDATLRSIAFLAAPIALPAPPLKPPPS